MQLSDTTFINITIELNELGVREMTCYNTKNMPTVPPDAPDASRTEKDIKEKRNLLFKDSISYDKQ